jgi:hypothetical protein
MEQYLIICQHCGEAHFLTPQTLKLQCRNCGKLIFHRGLAGTIDWAAMQQHPGNITPATDKPITV